MLRCNNRKIASPAGAFRMRRRHCRQRRPGLLPPAAPAGMETAKRAGSPFRGAPGSACHIGLPVVPAPAFRLCLSYLVGLPCGTDPARCYRMPWRPMGMPSPSVRCAALFRTGTHCGVCFIVSRSVATKKLIHPGERFIARPTTPPRLSMTV